MAFALPASRTVWRSLGLPEALGPPSLSQTLAHDQIQKRQDQGLWAVNCHVGHVFDRQNETRRPAPSHHGECDGTDPAETTEFEHCLASRHSRSPQDRGSRIHLWTTGSPHLIAQPLTLGRSESGKTWARGCWRGSHGFENQASSAPLVHPYHSTTSFAYSRPETGPRVQQRIVSTVAMLELATNHRQEGHGPLRVPARTRPWRPRRPRSPGLHRRHHTRWRSYSFPFL